MTDVLPIDAHLKRWDDVFASRSWGRYPPEELVRFVARTFDGVADRSKVRFLEVGCGPGANLWFLRRQGFSAAGIDGSQAALKQARERLAAEGLVAAPDAIDLRQGDIASLPWDAATFDAVIDIEAIYANEMATICACVAEVHRMLKPGGRFFGKMFGDKTTGFGTGRLLADGTSADPTEGVCAGFGLCHFFSEAELRALFAPFAEFGLDWVHRSEDGGAVSVFEWLVTARK